MEQFDPKSFEALAYAIEAAHSHDVGYLDTVRTTVDALAERLSMPGSMREDLAAAALLHNVGRLAVPQHVLHKAGPLTKEEQEKLKTHPVVAAGLASSLPVPHAVVTTIRHCAERWDGTGYPDGLKGENIPITSRVLGVACAYSALLHPRAFRPALPASDACEALERGAGSKFDPGIVTALLSIVSAAHGVGNLKQGPNESASALAAIASAQRESLSLADLADATTRSLHLEIVAETILAHARSLLGDATCVLFLPNEREEFLSAYAANGTNRRHLLGSLARIGAYHTGRAFTRDEIVHTSFLPNDLILRDVSDVWTPFRSTLILPLKAGGAPIGTLNLYSEQPDAFGPDTLRVLRQIAALAGRALGNAQRFAAVQETAYTDALTGLRNGRYLREFLDREINRARRESIPLAVLNIDLDNFKPINDQFGHARGDQTLREVAEILTDHIRSYDLAARYAGDEFVVVLARTGRLPAETVANKLKRATLEHGQALRKVDPEFPELGVSIGIALFPEDATDMQGLLCRSDAAMYVDKQAHRSGRQAA
jgi:diguanylate cyclase (GGDEF)-like protein